MKKLLPTIVLCVVFFATLFIVPRVYAADPTPTPVIAQTQAHAITEGTWVKDSDVTFTGKLAARSQFFLKSMLDYYQWYFLNAASSRDSLAAFWITIQRIVFAFFALVVLVTAFIIVITRGRSMSVMRFVPRFVGIALFVILSFSLVQFVYQATDIVQGFFVKDIVYQRDGTVCASPPCINADRLLNVSFADDYSHFAGYRLYGSSYDESVFITLLLAKLTSITMYVMAGVLFVRKIILWFFLLVSPIFPLLLLYSPARNTGKIWLGEFLKWLLYGPLFMLFAAAVVIMWKSGLFRGVVNTGNTDTLYPTATNLILGGPGQLISITNSINGPETFLLYILGLIMLWSIIIVPFVLLQIFLDYFNHFQPSESTVIKQLLNMGGGLLNRPPAPKNPPPPPSIAPAGMAKQLPFGMAKALPIENSNTISNQSSVVRSNPITTTINRPVTTTINRPITTQTFNTKVSQVTNSILKTANMNVPTLQDIARIEASSNKDETQRVNTTLEKISNPRAAESSTQREQFRTMRDQLIQEKQKGDPVAASVLSAATAASETKVTAQGTAPAAHTTVTLPAVNRVQSVSLEDYESVKKMWQETYEKQEAPKTSSGQMDRKEWVEQDMSKIEEAINKLQSHDPKAVKEGMSMVSSILPFLLMGGFSQTEILAYLKAKQEAAKASLEKMQAQKEGESTMVDREEGKKEEHAEMSMHAEAELEEPKEPKELDENSYNKPT